MARLGAAIMLAFLLSPLTAHADVWRCHQAGGPDLFTDRLKDPATCEKYLPQAELGYMARSSDSKAPMVTASQPIPMEEPPAPPETRREDAEPYTPTGYAQESYPSYSPCSYPYYDNPYYYSCPGVYGLFIRPRVFPFHRRSPIQPNFHSTPRSGFHHGGRHGGGRHR